MQITLKLFNPINKNANYFKAQTCFGNGKEFKLCHAKSPCTWNDSSSSKIYQVWKNIIRKKLVWLGRVHYRYFLVTVYKNVRNLEIFIADDSIFTHLPTEYFLWIFLKV